MAQIKAGFANCEGTEKPRPQDSIYYDHLGEENEKAFRWLEIDPPAGLGEPIVAGRVRFYGSEHREIMEINGRFFKQLEVYTEQTDLH